MLSIRGVSAAHRHSSNSHHVSAQRPPNYPPLYSPAIKGNLIHNSHPSPSSYHLPPLPSTGLMPDAAAEQIASHQYVLQHFNHPQVNHNEAIAALPRSPSENSAPHHIQYHNHQVVDNNHLQRLMPPPPAPPRYGNQRQSSNEEKKVKSHHHGNPHIHIHMAMPTSPQPHGTAMMSPHPPSTSRSASKNNFSRSKFRKMDNLQTQSDFIRLAEHKFVYQHFLSWQK